MIAVERFVLDYLLNSLWQVPLLLVTGVLAACLVRRVSVQAEHWVWVGALVAAVVVPACHLPSLLLLEGLWRRGDGVFHTQSRDVISAAMGSGAGGFGMSAAWGEAVIAIYGALLLFFCGRLLWGWGGGIALRQEAAPVRMSAEEARSWEHCCRWFDVPDAVLASSAEVTGPITLGVRRRVLLVPHGFFESTDPGDRDAALAHEFAHMRRRDFAKNLLYEVLLLPLAFHPLMWLIKSQVAQSRELVCDELAAEAMGLKREYAQSLLRLASMMSDRAPARTIHAIGIFDANILERRVMNLTKGRGETKKFARLAAGAACVLLGIAACGTAMALRMEVKAPAAAGAAAAATADHATKEKVDFKSPEILYRENPVYPPEARAAKDTLNGAVIVAMTVDTNGVPTGLHITKSLRADYDQSALTAVKSWRFTPATRNGEPVAVEMSVGINFQIYP